MNLKLILTLSLFGLAMAIATVFIIPSNIETFVWLPIFIICAYLIARRAPDKYFLHGLLTSLVNCVWITCLHVLLFNQYAVHHVQEIAMSNSMPIFQNHPRRIMLIVGPIIGVISGIVLGLFSLIASKMVKKA